jgi:hypothetical protein
MSTEKAVRSRLRTAFAYVRPPSATGFAKPTRTAGAGPSRTAADRLGPPELSLLQALVAKTNHARLDEYAERLFALIGVTGGEL